MGTMYKNTPTRGSAPSDRHNFDPDQIAHMVHHLVLPPHLPQREDKNVAATENSILYLLQIAANSYVQQLSADSQSAWGPVTRMLSDWDEMKQETDLRDDVLSTKLAELKPNGFLAFHLAAQNAGMMIFREASETIAFECFEVSPLSNSVMATEGRLLRTFPGRRVTFERKHLLDPCFRVQLAALFRQLNNEAISSCAALITKAGSKVPEIRDTTNPALVVDYLMNVVSALGQNEDPVAIHKRTRDDVLWKDALVPWRRSPFWLVAKVSIQRALIASFDSSKALRQYKTFMVNVFAQLLDTTVRSNASSELIATTHTKLARRIHKIGHRFGNCQLSQASEISQEARRYLAERWLEIQAKAQRKIKKLPLHGWKDAADLSLPTARNYLKEALVILPAITSSAVPVPKSQPRFARAPEQLPSLAGTTTVENKVLLLADIDMWVDRHLLAWTQTVLDGTASSQACDKLITLIKDYWALASSVYSISPLEKSEALLVVFELWVALDKICVAAIPLLTEYSPEISSIWLQALLESKLKEMSRHFTVETHINSRLDGCVKGTPGVFDHIQERSFSIRYFDSSTKQQDLCATIQLDDATKRAEKLVELERKTQEYRKLRSDASKLDCETWVDRWGLNNHSQSCKKCSLNRSAEYMTIQVHEKSLPENVVQRKAAVFELYVPVEFAAWRDATWFLIHDVGQRMTNRSTPQYAILGSYSQLSRYEESRDRQPIVTLASDTKSFLVAHYSHLNFPVGTDVCVNNGLHYRPWSHSQGTWLTDSVPPSNLRAHCTAPLPPGPYGNLDWAYRTSFHTSNDVMARQSDCHIGIELREFIAFASLRAGTRLQWLNMLRELGCSSLDHNAPAVNLLFHQAAYQAGYPSGGVYRQAHEEFTNPVFCRKLLRMLRRFVTTIEANWNEQYSMSTAIRLSSRLLSLTSDSHVINNCIELIHKARSVALGWCRYLKETYLQTTSNDEKLQQKGNILLIGAALLCFSTFDVENKHIADVLQSSHDLAVAAETHSIIHDHLPGNINSLTLEMQRNLLRRTKIAHASESRLRELLVHQSEGLTQAIQRLWHGANLESEWHAIQGKDGQWLSNTTRAADEGAVQTVHYNLLTGSLLVDGQPLGKVPDLYKKQSFFQRIFGPAILNVFASDMPGMTYVVSRSMEGNQVHLGLKNGHVIIKARFGDRVYQAIPPETFSRELPIHFVNSFVHWMDEKTGEVEFRPLDRPWQTSKENWKLKFSTLDLITARATMYLGHINLIDHGSHLGKSILQVLAVLDEAAYIHISTTDVESVALEVDLHRYNLHFSVTSDGELKSIEYGAVVDPDQAIGTLTGLQNKLVLREEGPTQGTCERSILIPYGQVSLQKTQHHMLATIIGEAGLNQRYFLYKLDRHLHKLRAPGDIVSSLHKAYLHAVTSFCLPDPFTHRTGTEEALATLQEASTSSFSPLSVDATKTLEAISSLTPSRVFYPKHLQQMQTVSWNHNLSTLSQHDDFHSAAKGIVEHNNQFVAFYPDSLGPRELEARGEQILLEKARNRNTPFRRQEDGQLFSAVPKDASYSPRDRFRHSDRSQRIYDVAKLVTTWPSQMPAPDNLKALLKGWDKVSGYNTEFDVSSLEELTTLDFATHWGSLYKLCCSASREESTFSLMFLFGAIAFGTKPNDVRRIQTLLSFAFDDSFHRTTPPAVHRSYTLATGSEADSQTVRTAIDKHTSTTWKFESEPPEETPPEERSAYVASKEQELKAEIEMLRSHVVPQWPARSITLSTQFHRFIDKDNATAACQKLFDEWHKNRNFLAHIDIVQSKLNAMRRGPITIGLPPSFSFPIPSNTTYVPVNNLEKLLQDVTRAQNVVLKPGPEPLATHMMSTIHVPEDLPELDDLVQMLRSSTNLRRNGYGNVLHDSLQALKQQHHNSSILAPDITEESLQDYHYNLSQHQRHILQSIRTALAPEDSTESILSAADMWPRITIQCLLARLAPSHIGKLCAQWKAILLVLGETVAQLQRSESLLKLFNSSDKLAFHRELGNPGRQGWSATQCPGWLLFEIENNVTIRPLQAKVAREMMMPSSGSNSVLQLNMGEGKSSVIIPMIVIALADTKHLVRVIVLKPLLRQTEQLLSQRLGGLLNQKIYHTPFSRNTKLTRGVVEGLASIFRRCEVERGVLLALPEHILSFRLMGREKMSSDRPLGAKLLGVERWLQQHCRDVLDESDEILDTRFQLVYTVGDQRMLDGQPDRWLITQAVLARVDFHVGKLATLYPDQLEIDKKGKSFPTMRFLRNEVGDRLTASIVIDLMEGQLQLLGFSPDYYTEKTRVSIERFIRDRSISEADVTTVTQSCASDRHRNVLLILRGLIAHGTLLFALQRKRWLVEYGLDPKRCLMAVPYRAKGVPSLSSEYGHPDVAILLTSLSYYYTGLTFAQIRQCFTILLKDTNAQDVYTSWISASEGTPDNLMSVEAINLEDETLCSTELFPRLRRNIEVANFYLTKVVFPKEGKEFAKRISASGWDIPSQIAGMVTTGFSGTNDNRWLLPFSIRQGDMPDLQHTSAMVLGLILEEENKSYVYAASDGGKKLDVPGLLSLVSKQSPPINVLIDVGAQVLEMTNAQVAKEWLKHVTTAKAAVYFADNDEAMVLDRNGVTCPLRISAFRARLENCLVYLDEVHTRGIDLPIQVGARAAVTLGPRLVKDRLVQACMRMRKLGCGHSLCFLSPPEVHHNILHFKDGDTAQITSKDVLAWCMEQTCLSMDSAQPLRMIQGLEFAHRQKILDTYLSDKTAPATIVSDDNRMAMFWEGIQEDESQTLDHMYGVHTRRTTTFARLMDRNSSDSLMNHLVHEFDTMDEMAMEDSSMDNEQEREVAHEIERERQVQRPGQLDPLPHSISAGLAEFIQKGSFDQDPKSQIYRAFQLFVESSASKHIRDQNIDPKSFSIFVTKDFGNCVALPAGCKLDEYLRPVNWVVTSLAQNVMLIISPYEANTLLPQIKASKAVRLHIFAARTNRKMTSFDDMDFYTPSSTPGDRKPLTDDIRALNLFAGSLYLHSMAEYESLCHFLGVVTPSRRSKERQVSSDGFADPSIRKEIGWPEYCPFNQTPLSFLRHVLSLRMHGQDYGHTHMGFLVGGNPVRESAFSEAV